MKQTILTLILLAALSLTAMAADAAAKKPRLKHVVSFKFKDGATKEDIAKVETAFKALQKKIKVIRNFESGENNSPEKLNKGFTHAWILTFNSEEDRDTYLHHPDHEAFGALAKANIADVFVIDFWTK